MISTELIIGLAGIGGALVGSFLTYRTNNKDNQIKIQVEDRTRFESIMSEQQKMYDNLQEEVNRLQTRVSYLEHENHELKCILSRNGISVIALNKEE